MLLALDIGNTNIVAGLFSGPKLVTRWRAATVRDRMVDEWWALLTTLAQAEGYRLTLIQAVAIASVVPALTMTFRELARTRLGCEPVIINGELNFGLPILVDYPREVGADRLCNAVAAFELFGGPAIVIDFGTATTFDVIDEHGAYLGGAIAPGLTVSLDALVQRASRLIGIELKAPPRAIGKNTIESMQVGTVLGYAELVRGLLQRIQAELPKPARIVSTGGLGQLITPLVPDIERYEPDLTLIGIRLIHERLTHTP